MRPITVSIVAPENPMQVEENVAYGSDNLAGPAQDYLVPVPSTITMTPYNQVTIFKYLAIIIIIIIIIT